MIFIEWPLGLSTSRVQINNSKLCRLNEVARHILYYILFTKKKNTLLIYIGGRLVFTIIRLPCLILLCLHQTISNTNFGITTIVAFFLGEDTAFISIFFNLAVNFDITFELVPYKIVFCADICLIKPIFEIKFDYFPLILLNLSKFLKT